MLFKNTIFLLFVSFSFCDNIIAQNDYKNSIQKALNFFSTTKNEKFPTYNLRELLHYSIRNTSFSASVNLDSILIVRPINDDDVFVFDYYKRLHTNQNLPTTKKLKSTIDEIQDVDKAMLWAIYADKLPKNKAVEKYLHTLIDDSINIRQIAHAAMSLKWLADISSQRKIKKYTLLRQKYIEICAKKIAIIKPDTDSGMEGVFALLLLNEKSRIEKDLIAKIVAAQNADGGWSWNEEGFPAVSNEHTTILAIAILTLYAADSQFAPAWVFK